MYEHNKSLRTVLYSHWMIYSPNVVVFRNDEGQLLNQPYPQSFLTAPAVNWSALKRNEPEKLELVEQVMSERIERVFNVAIHQQYQSLILGAWGCGVFGNSPQLVAGLFAKVLLDNPVYKNRFKHVVFAVLDRSSDESTIEPFKKLFQPAT